VLSRRVNINTKRNGLQMPKYVTAVYVRYRASYSFLHTREPYPNLDGPSASRRRHKTIYSRAMFLGTLQACLSSEEIYKCRLIEVTRSSGFLSTIQHMTNPHSHPPRTCHMLQHDRRYAQQRRITCLERFVSCKYSVDPFL